jgi:hypothetical protein
VQIARSCFYKQPNWAHKTHKSNGGIDPHWSCGRTVTPKSLRGGWIRQLKILLLTVASNFHISKTYANK